MNGECDHIVTWLSVCVCVCAFMLESQMMKL